MSKIIDAIEERQMNARVYEHQPLTLAVDRTAYKIEQMEPSWQYRLETRLTYSGFVRRAEDLIKLREQATQAIQYDVFGEFQLPLMELRHALWQRNFEGAEKKVDEIFGRMFSK